MLDYVINPVLMGGLVKETDGETVKIHLHGRPLPYPCFEKAL